MATDPHLAPSLHVGVELDSGTAVIRATGQLDQVSAARLAAVVETAVEEGCGRLEVELDLEFIGSAGLAALISAQRRAMEQGADFLLVRPSPLVVWAIDSAGLEGLFDIKG